MRSGDAWIPATVAFFVGALFAHLVHPRPGVGAPSRALHAPPHFVRSFSAHRFVRGNLHTHTTVSDGDASPFDVALWYRDHGYGFVAITDHNAFVDPARLGLESPDFALIPGEEVSMRAPLRQVHVNALCIDRVVPGGPFASPKDALEAAIGEILARGGVALVNHPNFDWALDESDVEAADGAALLEIASGHPYVHTEGDGAHRSHEQLWDDALTAGRDVMGVAVDDMHHLVTDADPEAFPGRGWVQVFADSPARDVLCDALGRGALYASTGAELRSIDVDETRYTVVPVDADARVVFVGDHGRILSSVDGGAAARYVVRGGEGYVRARVETRHGDAWTPAVRVGGG